MNFKKLAYEDMGSLDDLLTRDAAINSVQHKPAATEISLTKYYQYNRCIRILDMKTEYLLRVDAVCVDQCLGWKMNECMMDNREESQLRLNSQHLLCWLRSVQVPLGKHFLTFGPTITLLPLQMYSIS